MVVFQLTGDLDQLLHTGYAQDKGGTDVQVRLGDKSTNLDHAWDDDGIRQQAITFKSVEALYPDLLSTDLGHFLVMDFVYWMIQSRTYLPKV